MAPIADFILANIPLPSLPYHLTHYVPGQTPLSTTPEVAAALVTYLAVIFGLREVMRSQQALRLQFLFQVHNFVLSLGSAVLLVLMVEEIAPILWKHGIFYSICNGGAWTPVSFPFLPIRHVQTTQSNFPQALEFYYIINYYYKYLELLDTVFLALKKKPLGEVFSIGQSV